MKQRVLVIVVLVAAAACAGVLGLTRPSVDTFPHRKHVIAGTSCTTCHVDIERNESALHLPDDKTCVGCHTKPHDTRSCMGCHSSAMTAAELVSTKDHLEFDHAPHLKGPAKGNCMRCHGAVADGDRHLRPAMATCFKCHDDMREARERLEAEVD